MRRLASLVLLVACLATAAPTPTPLADAATILARSQAAWQSLTSYQVPVTVSAHVRVSIISIPVRMTGTQYYQAPDRQALHFDNPPSFARGLGDTLSAMGTPQTWLRDYTIGLPVVQPHGHHDAYVLSGRPKRSSRVKTMTMWVSEKTYGIESVSFTYTNGSSLAVTFDRHHGSSQYRFARSANVVAKFPGYSGTASITYGTYQLNQPIPPSVFAHH
jgi:outer membrane lipoprotein-sorting protein